MKFQLLSYLPLTAALAACGGGDGGSVAPAPSSSSGPAAAGDTGTTTQNSAITAANSCNIANFQVDMLRAINDARAKARSCGSVASPAVAAVAWNDTLFAVAAEHSQDMAERNYFAHDTPEGVNPFQRMDNAGYKHGAAGENIAAGQVGIASVMTAWLSSPGHCQGIMSGDFTQMAVGCVLNAKSTPYWTMDMASPR